MRSMVIGTAGHIDHGKSSLIKALTGTDPDRLVEEKSRGITIDLGFAHLQLADDLMAGIVDVPGHERFVKNMVAGTGGIDLVLMVVAADEGVMPQTREHLDICQLLGVQHGLIAVTKTDLVDDPEWLEMVLEDIGKEFVGTFLEDAPMVKVSSKSREGLDDLMATLAKMGQEISTRATDGPAFLASDRAFTMRGFGTVLTGTLVSGQLNLDDAVDLIPDPSGKLSGLKIRGLQSHGSDLDQANAGQRLAINLSGIEKAAVHRGQVLVHSGSLQAGSGLEVSLRLLPGAKALKTRKRLLFHTGTSKTTASLQIIGQKKLEPGQQAYIRVRCEEALAAIPGQYFILRGFSPIPGRGTTLGGGRILSIHPPHRREKESAAWIAELKILQNGSLAERLQVLLDRAGGKGVDLAQLAIGCGLGRKAVEKELSRMLATRKAFKFDRERHRFVSAVVLGRMQDQACSLLADYHQQNPLLPGMPSEHLRSSLIGQPEPRIFKLLINELTKSKLAVQEGENTRLAEHRVKLDQDNSALEKNIINSYEEAKLTPPRMAELVKLLDRSENEVRDLVQHLSRTGTLTHLTADVFISSHALADLEKRLVKHLEAEESIDTQSFKSMVGASRKHVIPLAEYFDRQKVTMRIGDKRVLRGRSKS